MSGVTRLWVIVEGRVHDRPFFDRLLQGYGPAETSGFTLRLAEQIEVGGVSAGGKSHVRSLFEVLESDRMLEVANAQGVNRIVFALDRDYDDIADQCIESPHVIYTQGMDVEADILLNGDLARAVGSTFSVPSHEVSGFIDTGWNTATRLARLWRDWIQVGASSASCQFELGVKYARHSAINDDSGFGEVDETKRDALHARLATKVADEGHDVAHERALLGVDRYFEEGREALLVSGKWVAAYVAHTVNSNLLDLPREANVATDVLTKTCIETLNFDDAWVLHWHVQLDALFAA